MTWDTWLFRHPRLVVLHANLSGFVRSLVGWRRSAELIEGFEFIGMKKGRGSHTLRNWKRPGFWTEWGWIGYLRRWRCKFWCWKKDFVRLFVWVDIKIARLLVVIDLACLQLAHSCKVLQFWNQYQHWIILKNSLRQPDSIQLVSTWICPSVLASFPSSSNMPPRHNPAKIDPALCDAHCLPSAVCDGI